MAQDAETIARFLLDHAREHFFGSGRAEGQAEWRPDDWRIPTTVTADAVDRVLDGAASYGLQVKRLILGTETAKRFGLDPTAPGTYRGVPVEKAPAHEPALGDFVIAPASPL